MHAEKCPVCNGKGATVRVQLIMFNQQIQWRKDGILASVVMGNVL